jgi:rhodanese-related sulfurtransferase
MQTITATELKQRLAAGENLHILDVREPHEYEAQNMGGTLIPLGQLMTGADEIEEWKTEEIIVHCRSGVRSMQACMLLEQMGFTNCKNLEGGIIAFSAE